MDPASEDLLRELADRVAALRENDTLTVTDLTPRGILAWTVRRDRNGTPGAQSRPLAAWESMQAGGILDLDKLQRASRADGASSWVIACQDPDSPRAAQALAALRAASPGTAFFHGTAPAGELVQLAIADAPLTRWYELVVLRRAPSGNLSLSGCQLFPPGARRGDRWSFTILCEPSDDQGTVLAVVASEPVRRFRLLSVQSVKIAPGTYKLTAELGGPGLVRFHGLPETLREDPRSWAELVGLVPAQLPQLVPAHLVCAVELSGGEAEAGERISRVQQLIETVTDRGNDRLSVSVIGYGPHAVSRGEPDEPPAVMCWADTPGAAVAALARLARRAADLPGYPRAAQVECVLAQVEGRLAGDRGRPVLVTAGSRPPFPPRVDPRSGIIPCPNRSDWRAILARLREQPGIAFGAICDGEPGDTWAELGRDALASGDAADDVGFAVGLGLLSAGTQVIPFPLVDAEQA
jgi:hypothetical protein